MLPKIWPTLLDPQLSKWASDWDNSVLQEAIEGLRDDFLRSDLSSEHAASGTPLAVAIGLIMSRSGGVKVGFQELSAKFEARKLPCKC